MGCCGFASVALVAVDGGGGGPGEGSGGGVPGAADGEPWGAALAVDPAADDGGSVVVVVTEEEELVGDEGVVGHDHCNPLVIDLRHDNGRRVG
ncbi:hypothetical protein GYH30_017206 [Glycine max]|nr:hypothetical protein GYH30_017206 [Glycine max]